MIKNYRFENFQSYRDECIVDFAVNKKTAHSYYDYEMLDGSKIAKVMAVLGANGAGKSNLLKPLSFVSWFCSHSFRQMDKTDKLPIFPYSLNKSSNSSLEVEFIIPVDEDTDIEFEFKYKLELNKNEVVFEELKIKTSRLYSTIFSRELNSETKKYLFKQNKSFNIGLSNSILKSAPSNCSLISYAIHMLDSEASNDASILYIAYHYFSNVSSNLAMYGKVDISTRLDEATEFFENEDEYFKFVKKLLMQYDLGIHDIKLEPKMFMNSKTGEEAERITPVCYHKTPDGEFNLPLFMESSGTQTAYCVLALIIESLKTGGLAILDEFDNDFHPQLTMAIVDLYKNNHINKNNAQLLFNTHTVEVLKHLRKQHCYLVEKDNGISDAYRIDEIDGLKERDNLYAKYISGALGATPDFD